MDCGAGIGGYELESQLNATMLNVGGGFGHRSSYGDTTGGGDGERGGLAMRGDTSRNTVVVGDASA